MTADEVVAAARGWLDVPYVKRGRERTGVDCLGLGVMVARELGVPHEDQVDYQLSPRADLLILRTLGRFLVRQPAAPIRPGLVGCFAERTHPGHIGIFSRKHGRIHLIHARRLPPRVVEESWEMIPRGELRLIGLFAFPGMTD